MAGSVFYLAPVDNASGKIFGKNQKWVAVRRLRGKCQRGCSVTGTRSTPVSIDETNARKKFAAVCKSTRLRMTDPIQNPVDQLGFAKQTKYTTFYGYVFRQEWDAYVEE